MTDEKGFKRFAATKGDGSAHIKSHRAPCAIVKSPSAPALDLKDHYLLISNLQAGKAPFRRPPYTIVYEASSHKGSRDAPFSRFFGCGQCSPNCPDYALKSPGKRCAMLVLTPVVPTPRARPILHEEAELLLWWESADGLYT